MESDHPARREYFNFVFMFFSFIFLFCFTFRALKYLHFIPFSAKPFSSPEPVVSWSRGRLQIKPSGSGDENGAKPILFISIAQMEIISHAIMLWVKDVRFFSHHSNKRIRHYNWFN